MEYRKVIFKSTLTRFSLIIIIECNQPFKLILKIFVIITPQKKFFIDVFPGHIEEIQNANSFRDLNKAVKKLSSSIQRNKHHSFGKFIMALNQMNGYLIKFSKGSSMFKATASNANFAIRIS